MGQLTGQPHAGPGPQDRAAGLAESGAQQGPDEVGAGHRAQQDEIREPEADVEHCQVPLGVPNRPQVEGAPNGQRPGRRLGYVMATPGRRGNEPCDTRSRFSPSNET